MFYARGMDAARYTHDMPRDTNARQFGGVNVGVGDKDNGVNVGVDKEGGVDVGVGVGGKKVGVGVGKNGLKLNIPL